MPKSTPEPGWTPVVITPGPSPEAVERARSPYGRRHERLLTYLANWPRRERLRRELMLLDSAALHDIGITRRQIPCFIRHAFRGDGANLTKSDPAPSRGPTSEAPPAQDADIHGSPALWLISNQPPFKEAC